MYARIDENGSVLKYPYVKSDFYKDFSSVSIPKSFTLEDLASYGVVAVQTTQPPMYDKATQKVVEATPINNGGQWEQAWNVVAKTQEEQDAYAREQQLGSRQDTAQQRIEQIMAAPQVKGLKTLADCQAYVDGQVSDLPSARTMMARLLFLLLANTRMDLIALDQIFPDDE